MAPTLEDILSLKELVSKLQERIQKIEQRTTGDAGESKSGPGDLRMILMGPPGAGLFPFFFFFFVFFFSPPFPSSFSFCCGFTRLLPYVKSGL